MLMMVCAEGQTARGENIDLSTVPARGSVQLTIYNSEDLTLVRETRTVSVKKGVNPLQFSWANTLIDPTSVDLRFRTHAGELDVLDTTFPHDKPEMLYWNVRSAFEGDVTAEITYFTSGISWSADYVCISDAAEEKMSFDGFVRITNHSGEDYPDANVRMVVGTINLVEKISELARRGLIERDDEAGYRGGAKLRSLNKPAREELYDKLGALMDGDSVTMAGALAPAEKEIEKQGLSEYFIYTVPGTETIPNQWSKRMRLFKGLSVPFRIQYRYRPQEYGDQLVRMLLLRNDKESGLGETPLPDGMVRLYRDNGRDGLSILVEKANKYVPIGQEIELNLGRDPEVIHERIRLASARENIWFQRGGANVYMNPQQGHRIEINDAVVGWDDRQRWVERIRNYRAKPIEVEIRRGFDGHAVFRSALNPILHDFRTVQFTATVKPAEKRDLAYELITHQGYNHKQDNVTLEAIANGQ